MKIQLFRKQDKGGALLAIAIVALIVAGLLSGYLLMVSKEMALAQRSETWNNAMGVAESGVEEGLALVNEFAGNPNATWTTNATHDGWDTANQASLRSMTWMYNGTQGKWAATNGTIYHVKRYLDSSNGFYEVYINNSSSGSTNGPEILSIGCADWNGSLSSATNAVRKVYLQTITSSQLGDDGLIADALTFHGNNVTIDSFNSTSSLTSIWTNTSLYFHGARYGTWAASLSYDTNQTPHRTANVHVAAETNYIDVGNANIYGYINTAPGGTENVGSQGSVGDLNWVHGGSSGLQPGHFKDDMNQSFISLTLPNQFSNAYQNNHWLPVTASKSGVTNIVKIGGTWVYTNLPGVSTLVWTNLGGYYCTNKNNSGWTVGGVTYYTIITNKPDQTNSWVQTNSVVGAVTNWITLTSYSPYANYYTMNSIGSSNLFVDAQYAVLYVTNGMSSPTLTVNTNADITIYSGGDISFGTTVNNTALARALTICDIQGHPIAITASGNASGVAKLYIPSSSITLNGGGNNTYDIIGEITCQSATFNGHFNLHFDESLVSSTPSTQFVTSLWREVQ